MTEKFIPEGRPNHYINTEDGSIVVVSDTMPNPQDVVDDMLSAEPSYKDKRAMSYPRIQDQLDMLYHTLKLANIEGPFIDALDDIKNSIPKE